MRLPTIKECFDYFDQFEMLDNIRAHSVMVSRVAETLFDHLANTLPQENLPIKNEVIVGAMMHDIAKTSCLKTGQEHALEGQRICSELGYIELGEIVAEHVLLKNFRDDLYQKGQFGTKELVFYSDKRVNHDKIASLAERETYITEHYGRGDAWRISRIEENFAMTRRLEAYLFTHLGFTPEQLEERLLPA